MGWIVLYWGKPVIRRNYQAGWNRQPKISADYGFILPYSSELLAIANKSADNAAKMA